MSTASSALRVINALEAPERQQWDMPWFSGLRDHPRYIDLQRRVLTMTLTS